MKMSRVIGAAIILASAVCPLIAQNVPGSAVHPVSLQVHGQVRYERGAPAANVLVRLEAVSGGIAGQMMTDRTGKFQFAGLRGMQYVLTIHTPGYQDVRQTVDLLTATSDYVNATLQPDGSLRQPEAVRGIIDARVPPAARTEYERGVSALSENKEMGVGIRHLEKAVAIYPDFLEATLRLGAAYMDAEEWTKAEAALRQALKINPQTANAYLALGEIYYKRKNYGEAKKVLRQGLEIENRSWQGHFALGRVCWESGDLMNSARQTAIALQLNPDLADAHLLAGNIWLRVGKRDEALQEFQTYLRLAPKGEFNQQARAAVERIRRPSEKSNP
jgi:Carboxypeptidase regulatory-like domain/Tetratricopeptide repeat